MPAAMIRFIARRILIVIPTLFAIALLLFVAIRMVPGDPIEVRTGERGIAPERHAMLLHQYGMDQPIWRQFLRYLGQLVQGDFGVSIVTSEPVLKEFLTLFPATVELALSAILFAILLGVPAGVIAAVKRGGIVDHTLMGLALTGFSMPIFWWGLLLILFVSVQLGWTPVSGRIDLVYYFEPVTGFMLIDSLLSGQEGAFGSAVSHLILPAIVLGTIPLAIFARMTRSSMLEVLGEDYVRTARAKGLSPWRVTGLHALRNALIPVVTVIGLQIGNFLAGAVLTEYVFSWPGVGSWLIESIARRDYPVLQGGILIIASFVILVNIGVDLLYGVLNPKIRHAR
jgi:dipeptide transport system permease protein